MRAAKGGPQALFELPPREGFSPSDQGHFSGLSAGSQIIRGGQNQFGTVMWSAGDGGSQTSETSDMPQPSIDTQVKKAIVLLDGENIIT